MITRAVRTQRIEKLAEDFGGARGIFLTDITKLTVEKVTRLRSTFRRSGVKYVVVKNTLARKAIEKCDGGKQKLAPFFKGTVGVVLSAAEFNVAPKIIRDFQKENAALLAVKAGYAEGSVFTGDEVVKLADIPGRGALLSQVLSAMQGPIAGLAGVLSGFFTAFIGTLEAVRQQKEKQS